MTDKHHESGQIMGARARERQRLLRKRDEAIGRTRDLKMKKGVRPEPGKEHIGGSDRERIQIQDEIMWFDLQLQAMDAHMDWCELERPGYDSGQMRRIIVTLQKECESRMFQYMEELDRMDEAVTRIKRLYLRLIGKMGELQREAKGSEIVLEKVRALNRQSQGSLGYLSRPPEIEKWIVTRRDVEEALAESERQR